MSSTQARDWSRLAKQLWHEVDDDHVSNGAGALAFYMVLALFPAAIFGLSLLPYLPIPHLREAIMDLVRQALPGPAADMLTGTVESVVSRRNGGLLSFGFLLTIWSASSGVYAIMQELNVVYDVREERSFIRARAVALLLTFCFFILVVGALALVVFGGMLQSFLDDHLGWSGAVHVTFAILRWVIIIAAIQLAFSLVYHLGPNLRRRFVLVTPGSVFATFALVVASLGFKLYVSNFGNYDAIYGSLGAVIVLLMWLLVAGWVLLLGGELNDVLHREKHELHESHAPRPDGEADHELEHRHA